MTIWERFLRIFRRDKKTTNIIEKGEIVLYEPIKASLEKDIEKKREAIQSYILTAAKYNFSEYEKKILSRLIEGFQFQLEGQKLESGFSITQNQYGDVDIILPISLLTVGEDLTEENHTQLEKALHSLLLREVSYKDNEAWTNVGLIERPGINEKNRSIQFRLHHMVRGALMSFSSGYRKQELDAVMSFRSIYTKRFHELLKNTNESVRYSIDELKEMFQLENKYKPIKIFISRVIEQAKKELDTKGSFSFTYQLEYEKHRINPKGGRKRIIAIVFTPIYPSAQHLEKPEKDQQAETVVPEEEIIPSTSTHKTLEADSSVEFVQTNQQNKEQGDNKETVTTKQSTSVRYFLEEILGIDNSGELEELTDLALSKGGSKYLTNLFRTCNRDVDITIEKLIQLKTDSLSAPVSESAEVAKHDSNMSHQF